MGQDITSNVLPAGDRPAGLKSLVFEVKFLVQNFFSYEERIGL